MLILQTKPNHFYSKEKLKTLFHLFKKNIRGPQAVLQSLERGLHELHIPYRINTNHIEPKDTIHIISNSQALKEAIQLKKIGNVKKIIAGPNIVISPFDSDKVLMNPLIDMVLVPSAWVRDFYLSFAPELKDKIKIWPAGVIDPGSQTIQTSENKKILIYQKNAPLELLEKIKKHLTQREFSYEVLTYGSFKQKDYFEKLKNLKCMIYLSESESQGMALHEAWIRNIPTLVWNQGFWKYKDNSWKDPKISAPYLTDECGYFFKDMPEFIIKFDILRKRPATLNPREYSLKKFTDLETTKNYLLLLSI